MSADPSDRSSPAVTARIVRRELHSSRAVPSVMTAIVLVVAHLVLLFEAVLRAVGDRPFLVDLEATAAWIGALPAGVPPTLLGTGALLLVVLGVLLLLLAVLPGRRARYTIPNPRAAVVVDAEVVASSLARRARVAAGVAPEQVLVTVGRSSVTVQIRPTSGVPVDADAVRAAVADDLRRSSVEPAPRISVVVAESGVIGQ
ncbi:hypothetical protein FJV46_09185 [Arthrobacter agilis]|uniref:DUF6286 domain-containing protein n=1 Tax=Arthrobacter agilis TaxID=37921 RepID=UPI000B35A5F2|nr:DUF6286 domain-containing protein [Arthrobacter agilis]OUM43608.1 hypothetical protein B8W74_05430 [Arthrobacter agilis]PPB46805.1 hypothetical protein CI784_05960 [Arthrobacter agilis]TPV24853.1 hypothetical protein FJV46_09185 [Arthrobacter agilis]WDF33610.1 DUF6286 domain-containing protein [Arthrobacter agilis]VDR31005.1 Uncharacterised protein [Arthrobacter agilis]